MKSLLSLWMAVAICAIFTMATPAAAQTCDENTVQGNCVLYARSQVPSLPTGLTSFSSKLAIINHMFPRVGSVAVIASPPGSGYEAYGHVAVVRNVVVNSDGRLTITVQESHWGDCAIATRTITPGSRDIRGYFDPGYPAGQSAPRFDSPTSSFGYAGVPFTVSVAGSSFDINSVQGIILGGWCDSFGKCAVPTSAIQNRTSTSLQVPLTLNSSGNYTLYLFNASSGKTSNGQRVTIY